MKGPHPRDGHGIKDQDAASGAMRNGRRPGKGWGELSLQGLAGIAFGLAAGVALLEPGPAIARGTRVVLASVEPAPRPVSAAVPKARRGASGIAPASSPLPAPRPSALHKPMAVKASPRAEVSRSAVSPSAMAYAGRPSAVGYGRTHRIWCATYVKAVTDFDIHADAYLWWSRAAHRYARGIQPAAGAVLAFRAIRRMPLGHVALVTKVLGPRMILVNQANWVRNTVTVDTQVRDVSAKNDWSEVRVQNLDGSFGGVYPTHGFIYDQAPSAKN